MVTSYSHKAWSHIRSTSLVKGIGTGIGIDSVTGIGTVIAVATVTSTTMSKQ